MTSVKGAGYSSSQNRRYDPLGGGGKVGSGAKLLKKENGSPGEQANEMEKKVCTRGGKYDGIGVFWPGVWVEDQGRCAAWVWSHSLL